MQQIGALAEKISRQSPNTSSTTTAQKATHSRTLAPRGGRGLQTIPSLTEAIQAANPSKTLEAVKASLAPEMKSSLKPEYGPNGNLKGYVLNGAHGPQAIQNARKILEQSLTPMTGNEALDLLTELKAMTRPAPGTTDDLKVVLKAYLKRCMDYPADVVRHVLTTQADESPWWPSWQELKDRLEIHTYRRRMMLEALTR